MGRAAAFSNSLRNQAARPKVASDPGKCSSRGLVSRATSSGARNTIPRVPWAFGPRLRKACTPAHCRRPTPSGSARLAVPVNCSAKLRQAFCEPVGAGEKEAFAELGRRYPALAAIRLEKRKAHHESLAQELIPALTELGTGVQTVVLHIVCFLGQLILWLPRLLPRLIGRG